jgi:hypothetical protein
MPRFQVRFETVISLVVTIDGEDEDVAADAAWELAEDYLRTVHGHHPTGVRADATLDGIGASDVSMDTKP